MQTLEWILLKFSFEWSKMPNLYYYGSNKMKLQESTWWWKIVYLIFMWNIFIYSNFKNKVFKNSINSNLKGPNEWTWISKEKKGDGEKASKNVYLFELTGSECNDDGMLKCNLSSTNKITEAQTNTLDYFYGPCSECGAFVSLHA